MDKIDEGPACNKGHSFRAIAEARARKCRAEYLRLTNYDGYGHILSDEDGRRGANFLPSLRADILTAVTKRKKTGKGVDFGRTSQNMLSSQAMCFNLFVPLNRDRRLAAELLGRFIDGLRSVDEIEYEHTPHNSIFGDQSGKVGVDCDVLVHYTGRDRAKGLAVIETKYTETGFSICGFRKSNQEDPCPSITVVNDDYSNCRYKYKKKYAYWEVAEDSGLYHRQQLHVRPCPFGGSLWQLWTNLSLAYALAKQRRYSDFRYVVICPEGNTRLSRGTKVFSDFRLLLRRPDFFEVIYLEDIGEALRDRSVVHKSDPWADEFIERYCWRIRE